MIKQNTPQSVTISNFENSLENYVEFSNAKIRFV